ncbi:NAD-dependent epimerase/dehydratase family protein [Pseudomonadota bacterium]
MESGELAGKRVLVTGARGFIGANLCDALVVAGANVHAVSRVVKEDKSDNVRWWQGDLADFATAEHIFAEACPEYIFHMAGIAAGSRDISMVLPTLDSNLISTVNMLVLAKKGECKRFILPGSMEEPGDCEADAIPSSPYAASKWGATVYAKMFHALYDVPVVILRVFMVYGPSRQNLNKLIPYVILSLLRQRAPSLGSGQRDIDWVYIDDVVDALLKSAAAPDVIGKTLDIGSGKAISVQKLVRVLVDIVNPEIAVDFGGLPDRPFEQERVANITDAEKLMDWEPRTSLQEGLKKTVSWYRGRVKMGDIDLSF